nr:type II secretion system protein F [Gammaproteobacteria bacterium]
MAWLLGLVTLACLIAGGVLLHRGVQQAASERVLYRLTSGLPVAQKGAKQRWLQRELLRAGFHLDGGRLGLWLGIWLFLALLGGLLGGWPFLLVMAILPPVLMRLYVAWRYRLRVRRMIEQMPALLDHVIRSLKSGRTLGDALLLAMENAADPLHTAFARSRRNIERGMALEDALDDFAELYEQDEFRILALGVRVNQRYGGNASELLENLIVMIRDRERASRQLRAMTGETRISALILGCLPISLAIYIFITNPAFLLGLWADSMGKLVLLVAFLLQLAGSFLMWRMLRSV